MRPNGQKYRAEFLPQILDSQIFPQCSPVFHFDVFVENGFDFFLHDVFG